MEGIEERKINGLTVRIKRYNCIATGNCMKVAGELFQFDEEQISSFRPEEVTINRERLIEACRVCPVGALVVIDEEGKQIVPERNSSGGEKSE
jgi:ferredoxin